MYICQHPPRFQLCSQEIPLYVTALSYFTVGLRCVGRVSKSVTPGTCHFYEGRPRAILSEFPTGERCAMSFRILRWQGVRRKDGRLFFRRIRPTTVTATFFKPLVLNFEELKVRSISERSGTTGEHVLAEPEHDTSGVSRGEAKRPWPPPLASDTRMFRD